MFINKKKLDELIKQAEIKYYLKGFQDGYGASESKKEGVSNVK